MKGAVHVGRWGNVFFYTDHTEAQVLDGLKMLRDVNLRDDIRFFVEPITWTERISQEMIKTFQYHLDMGRHWKFARFGFEYETNAHVHSVLQSPVTTDFFREFDIVFGYDYHLAMRSQEATTIAFILRRGCSVLIKDVEYCGEFGIGQECMSILSEGLVTLAGGEKNGGDTPQYLSFSSICFLHDEDSWETRSAAQCLADGLERNKTLNSFCCFMPMNDDAAAKIVRSLIGNPSLTNLDICGVEFGELTTTAIRRE